MREVAGETYSDVTRPLRELTRQGVWFKWSEECHKAFQKLKNMLVADTVLVNYDTRRATRLYVDHGPVGIGAKWLRDMMYQARHSRTGGQ